MKKISLLLFAIFTLNTLLNAQDSGVSSSGKKLRIGAGLSTNLYAHGLNFKGDYILNDKLSIGLNTFINSYPGEEDLSDLSYSSKSDAGKKFNISAGASYYLKGTNSNENNLGLYAGLGLGYFTDRQQINVFKNLPITDKSYYNYTKSYNYNYLASTVSLGGDYKIGKGKLFIEIPIVVGILSKNSFIYKNQQWNNGITQPDFKADSFSADGSIVEILLNVGYQIYF